MSHNPYCEEERLIVRNVYPNRGWKATQKALKTVGYQRTMDSICKQAGVLGVKGPVKRWTNYEDWLMREYYPFEGLSGMVSILRTWGFNRTKPAVQNRSNKLGIKCLFNHGRYGKGQIPFNKGKKMSVETYAKVSATMFKKGNKPHNTKHDNAVSIRKDSSGYQYKYIRISEGNWKLLHRIVWEDANGPIPKDHLIVFKDKDALNCDISNLECISNTENLDRNRDREKAANSIRSLSDKYVAGRMAMNNPELRKKLLTMPDLLEIQRQKMLINREIKSKSKIKRTEKSRVKDTNKGLRTNT